MQRRRWVQVVADAASALLGIVLVLAPIFTLGVNPDLEAALCFTVVVLILLGAGWILLGLVFAQRRPQPASGPAELPGTRGSSA